MDASSHEGWPVRRLAPLAFYVGKLGFLVHTDVRNGEYRWLTVQHPDQPSFQLGLFAPGPPVQASEMVRSTCQATALMCGSKLKRPTICSSAASLRFAAST
jgi:hypothetical protein